MILDKLKAWGAIAAAIALGSLLLVQTGRLHLEQRAHTQLQAKVDRDHAAQVTAALKHEIKTSADESAHAKATQENSDAFTTSQPVRDAIARADLDRLDRLRVGAERRAATYRAQAQSNAAACSDLADRHATLDAHVVRGANVVAGHGADLERRDAEVVLLRGQIDADRALMGAEK